MSTLITTDGIVLHSTHYSESAVIARIFTRAMGVQSYMVKGVRGRNGKVKQNQLEPLSHIELTAYNNPRAEIQYVKEITLRHAVADSSMVDNALRFFKAELLYKTLRNDDPQPVLFDYVTAASPYPAAHQPILFLLHLSRHLGIEPLDDYSDRTPHFNPDEGHFEATVTVTGDKAATTVFDPESSTLLHLYLQTVHHEAPLPAATQSQRNRLLDLLLAYFGSHLNEFHHFTSHEILHTVLN